MTSLDDEAGTPPDGVVATRRGWSFAARAATWVTCVGALTVLILLRQSGNPPWRTVWAEDGVFVSDAYESGIASIDMLHAGYLHIGSRLLAFTGTLVPIDQLARFNALSAALLLAVGATIVFWWSEDLVPSPLLRGLLALAVCLHPLTIVETLASTTNLEWPLTFLSLLALLHRPRTPWQLAGQVIVAALAPVSQAAALLWAPVALWYVVRRKPDGRKPVGLVFLASCAIQTVVALSAILTGSTTVESGTRSMLGTAPFWLAVTWGNAIFGLDWLQGIWGAFGYWTIGIIAIIVAALISFLVLKTKQPHSAALPGLGFVALSFVFIAFVTFFRGLPPIYATDLPTGDAHYVYVSLLLLLTGIFMLVEALPPHLRRIVAIVAAAHMIIIIAFAFRMTNARSDAPTWHPAVVWAQQRCQSSNVTSAVVIIAPAAPWTVEIPCSTIP